MNEQVKTDITVRSHDKQHVLWAKLSAVRVGIVDKEQVKLGNQRDYLTWIPICVAKSRNLLSHGYDLDTGSKTDGSFGSGMDWRTDRN